MGAESSSEQSDHGHTHQGAGSHHAHAHNAVPSDKDMPLKPTESALASRVQQLSKEQLVEFLLIAAKKHLDVAIGIMGEDAHVADYMFDTEAVQRYENQAEGLRSGLEVANFITKAPWWTKGMSVLDFGCGPGLATIELAKTGASRVVGADVAEAMLTAFRKRFQDAGFASLCSTTVLNATNGSDIKALGQFDVVMTTYVLGHVRLSDVEPVLSALAAAVKPGGVLVIGEFEQPKEDSSTDFNGISPHKHTSFTFAGLKTKLESLRFEVLGGEPHRYKVKFGGEHSHGHGGEGKVEGEHGHSHGEGHVHSHGGSEDMNDGHGHSHGGGGHGHSHGGADDAPVACMLVAARKRQASKEEYA
eukprot:gb/GEZN01008928.1/.p1 GENE.gb/GEZN01008928.1/~~gb/GEZN01008928.1/.p1  ORF type:complete len:360 (+),score=53.37 gb/GEZN01008928.1/:49-1128(+)